MAELTLRGITRRYAGRVAVEALDLDVAAGEFLTLLGPSGCGKSTTLKVIAGLVAPDAGEVRLAGHDVTRLSPARRGIGMVFQSLALFPHMTVAENVAFGLRMRRVTSTERRRRVAEALDLVQLADFADRLPAQLSGGQQQRVALARAFVIEPPLMLLDEPLGALDRKLREEMQVEIRSLTRRLGVTAIFVTHDQEEALTLSDRVAVMNGGRIEQIDTPQAVFRTPATAFVARFMGVANLLPGQAGAGVVQMDGLPGLALPAARAAGTPRRALIGLRPEDARLVRGNDHAPDVVAARVGATIYQGAQIAVTVRPLASPGQVMLARLALPPGEPPPEVGETVGVAWPASAILVFPEE